MLIQILKNENLQGFWWSMVKNEFGQSGLLTLKLTVFQERTDETGFLHAGTISHKLNGD